MSPPDKTEALHQRARRVMPGRQSNFRDVPGAAPFFLESALDLTYTDVDGRKFIDFTISMGAAIWGYSDADYKSAVAKQLDTLLAMSSGAAQSALEVELAEAIVARVPGAEWVRFGISGSEAVQLAIRLGRAHTGRPLFVRFAGHYHGWMDNVAGGGLPSDADLPHPVHFDGDPGATNGRSPHAFEESLILPWNDADALESLLKRHGDRIAVVAMEAIMCNNACCPPRPGYLERVRELCDQYGCVLFFDEVITGFRVAPGGAQDLLGVSPDIATYGKALAGGLPLSAIAGKKEDPPAAPGQHGTRRRYIQCLPAGHGSGCCHDGQVRGRRLGRVPAARRTAGAPQQRAARCGAEALTAATDTGTEGCDLPAVR